MKIPTTICRMPRVVLTCLALAAQPALGAEQLGASLPGLLDYAREHNPELAAMRHEADAARQRVQPAGALPDPVLRAELMDVTNQGTNKPPSLWPSQVGNTRYLLMQSVPWLGKRDLQRGVAEAQADQADGQAASTWAELSGRIKTAYAMYYYLSGSERLAQQALLLMNNLERVAQTRYANGLGAQQDVLRAQVEQTALRTELVELESERHHEQSRLNALLSRPAMAELAEPAQLRPLPPPAQLDYAVLEQKLRARNPQLQVAEAQVQSAGKGRDLAYARRYPDFTLGIAPNQSGNAVKSWDVMVEFNIPLQQGSRRSQEREAEAMLAASESRKQSLQDRMQAALSESLYALETARRTESLAATRLLPQSELNYQSALAGYETGKVEFAMLIEAQRQILNAQRQRLKAQLEAQSRLAEIESLLGEEL
ncbi:outer membrane efflux protein [Ferriphaselus amnicola]|uniref:Outer membrane efflux protein n=1 Tax=Ferriphaselus amnicola TaxID=1188319 RepID=A0A2Z6GC29_9PROT|nr:MULTISPECIES: TolC family protein [Ferriphaselus]BBE50932.1 outer membrane efflux protein [Ferriphaselus amnicola]